MQESSPFLESDTNNIKGSLRCAGYQTVNSDLIALVLFDAHGEDSCYYIQSVMEMYYLVVQVRFNKICLLQISFSV